MRFSAGLALCAAPLALAGLLQAEMPKRAVEVQVSNSNSNSRGGNGNGNGNGNNRGNNNAVGVTEVIIVWVNNGGGAATNTVNSAVAAATAGGAAATHTVVVGGSAGLQFTPNTLSAAVGDMVVFTFMSANHTATQSAFDTPCDPLAGGMDSGFMPNANNSVVPPPQMAMQVSVATPLWFYCRQAKHCGKGMTFSINPSANKTQAAFQQLAIAQKGEGATAAIVGGAGASGAAPAAAAPAATNAVAPPANAAAPANMAAGTGTNVNGECACSCLCGPGSFPSSAVQGVGGFGGVPGAMPMAAMMA
ncbi:uncharacterized protein BP5553_05480 [Venustampulla echinocandica]|uniref:Cupredoxin n=1 Tax=Venustampulla echinocandica TaxID=2656787 RepID=A0A370TR93_9HELO|nr:uncharacterized protein BP5553_05480 [Venustampulla echinocandica]RDL38047.1 hypothetical protein BP5553_05480 [Venustampulla echinocandica]